MALNFKLKGMIVSKYGTQFAFANALKEHETAVSKILRGQRKLTEREGQKWAKALDVDVN